MTGLQIFLLTGAVIGVGLAGVVYALVPIQPDLGDVLARLSPVARHRSGATSSIGSPGTEERLGIWAERTLPARLLGVAPAKDLAVLQRTPAQFYGRKVIYGVAGLVLPSLANGFAAALGFRLPFAVPVAATVALAVFLYLSVSRDVAQEAKKARADAARALSAYIALCAMERNAGKGAAGALTSAAEVGGSWVFRRIREELGRARYSGQPPWDALSELGATLGLPELGEVADIMRLAGNEEAEVYAQLQARSAAVRDALLGDEISAANAIEEQMYVPGALLGAVFLALLMAPPLLRLLDMS